MELDVVNQNGDIMHPLVFDMHHSQMRRCLIIIVRKAIVCRR